MPLSDITASAVNEGREYGLISLQWKSCQISGLDKLNALKAGKLIPLLVDVLDNLNVVEFKHCYWEQLMPFLNWRISLLYQYSRPFEFTQANRDGCTQCQ